VEGVKLDGSAGGALLGGVCALVPSLTLLDRDEAKFPSGDRACGMACGIVFSKSSARNNVENVRLASSARSLSV